MDATTKDTTLFRPAPDRRFAHWFGIAVCLATVALAIHAISTDTADNPALMLCCGIPWFLMGALLVALSGWVESSMTIEVGPQALVVRTRFETRRFAWAELKSWQLHIDGVSFRGKPIYEFELKMPGWFAGIKLHESELARPGFDRFLELVRLCVGDKEGPRPPANV